jgi:flavin prenyltransferase
MATARQRLIVGITGASGAAYGLAALNALRSENVETHLVISRSGQITAAHELGLKFSELTALADVAYKIDDIAAAISSGSFKTLGMLVAPCSIRSHSEIASGVTSSLLSRAADVVLKERRKLVLMMRETPFSWGIFEPWRRLRRAGTCRCLRCRLAE